MENFFRKKKIKAILILMQKKSFRGCKFVGKSNNIMIKNENNEDKQNKKIN
jgi:hypothetical protein